MRKNKNFKKLMIYAITLVMCLSAITIVGNAAYIELGDAMSTQYESYVPFYGYYDYGWSAVIYLQSELGGAKNLIGLTYDVYDLWTGAPYTIFNQKIYMKHTTDTDWIGNLVKPDPIADGYTEVFSGDITFTAIGFADYISFDTTFSYDGSDNLIIYWENWDGDWNYGQPRWQFKFIYPNYRVKYRYADYSMPGNATSASYNFPNIRIHFQPDHDVTVKDIISPEPVEETVNLDVLVKVKNEGLNTETFPVNVKINAPPIINEGFEDCYSIRPYPPPNWAVEDTNGDGYYSSLYAYNMWGSYYSSYYAHTGTMLMRCEDGGFLGNDDWLFTNAVELTAGVSYELSFWDRVSTSGSTYDNNLDVWIGSSQDSTGMTTMLWTDTFMYHMNYRNDIVTFSVPTTGIYYLGFWRHNIYSYADMFIDDVSLCVPGSLVYDQTVTITNLAPGVETVITFPDWVVTISGNYRIIATTLLATDEYTPNDQIIQHTQVDLSDSAIVTIDIKPGTFPNDINLNAKKGRVPVAILTDEDFDASTVDPDTIVFLDASPVHWALKDVDNDTDIDMILQFIIGELDTTLVVDEGGEYPYAYLSGETINYEVFFGKDTVNIIQGGTNTIISWIIDRFPILEQLLHRFPFFEKILNQIKL